MIKPKLMIIGYARYGKDTLADILQEDWGYKHTASSFFMAENVVFPAFQKLEQEGGTLAGPDGVERPAPRYNNVIECWNDRHQYRSFWFNVIAAANYPDGAYLAKAIFAAGNNIYSGCRNDVELWAGRLQRAVDLVIWVDRSKHQPPEPLSSCNIDRTFADVVVDNNGTLDDLRRNAHILYANWIKPLEKR